MKKLLFFCISLAAVVFLMPACVSTITRPLHSPIYPSNTQNVTYSLDVQSSRSIERIQLYETVSTISSSGTITTGSPALIRTWNVTGAPTSHTVSFTKSSAYGTDKVITYRFDVTTAGSGSRSHPVTFATRPYPVANQPVPVYAQGHIDDVFDVIFIPDTDITNMETFRTRCSEMIENTIHREPMLDTFNRQFNFYINPLRGTATDYDRIAIDGLHRLPSNTAEMSFAEIRVLMHQNLLRDYSTGSMFSTEMDRPQTFIHEAGHGMFGLADEYCGGAHWQAAELPNNWSTLAAAQADAPSRRKTASDARQMCTTGWYKLCHDSCPMISGPALFFDYDDPCSQRVMYEILMNALH